jgi:hypothetical protein
LAAKILGGSGVGAGFNNAHPAPPAASSDSTSATGAIHRPGAGRDVAGPPVDFG